MGHPFLTPLDKLSLGDVPFINLIEQLTLLFGVLITLQNFSPKPNL